MMNAEPEPDDSEEAELVASVWKVRAPKLSSEDGDKFRGIIPESYGDCCIFPPNLHEGLHIHPNPDQTLFPSPPTSQKRIKTAAIVPPYLPTRPIEEEEEPCVASKPFWISAQIMMGSWVEVIRSKVLNICGGGAESVGLGACSLAALVGLTGFLVYLRRCHRREKEFLLFLIHEKNQKIGLLLHQIAELNAVIAAHRKVPVLRRTLKGLES